MLLKSLKVELVYPGKLRALAHQLLVWGGSGLHLDCPRLGLAPRCGWFKDGSFLDCEGMM